MTLGPHVRLPARTRDEAVCVFESGGDVRPERHRVRVGHPLFECIFPIIIGVVLWGAPYLLDGRVRAVFPVRR